MMDEQLNKVEEKQPEVAIPAAPVKKPKPVRLRLYQLRRRAKEELKKLQESQKDEADKGSPFSWSAISRKGNSDPHMAAACYYSLRYNNAVRPAVFADFSWGKRAHRYNKTEAAWDNNPEGRLQYMDWWLNRSFLSRVFLTKDAEKVLVEGAVVDGRKYSANVCITAMMGLRYLSEYPRIVKTWLALRGSIPDDATIIAAHKFAMLGSPGKPGIDNTDKFIQSTSADNHTWFQNSFGRSSLRRVMTGDIIWRNGKGKKGTMEHNTNFAPLMKWAGASDEYGSARDPLLMPPMAKIPIKNAFGGVIREEEAYFANEKDKWLKEWLDMNLEEKKVA